MSGTTLETYRQSPLYREALRIRNSEERNETMKYSIDKYDQNGGFWIWAGDGDTDNGTTAQLPDPVYDFADSGEQGEIEAEGELYRIRERGEQ